MATYSPPPDQPRCEDCERTADAGNLVGMGTPPVWLCLPCFVKAVEQLGEKLRQLRRARLN